MKLSKPFPGIIAFLVVLLTMPLGHAVMIIMEVFFGESYVYAAALVVGLAGVVLFMIGSHFKNENKATFAGLFAGILIWTGWIEFAHVYIAHRYGVAPLMENGVTVTKPEYLIMPASVGFLATFMIFYTYNSRTGCNFFIWIQKTFRIPVKQGQIPNHKKNYSLITTIETISILWTFYLVLLFAYDNSFFGDRHPVTYFIAFGSLLWSAYLFVYLLKIENLGYAIRYSIPTVIIFWNFVEILGRWNVLNEIWVKPYEYKMEVLSIFIVFVVLLIVLFFEKSRRRLKQEI
ncbi:MAG: hypothetical protein NT150_13995 [Bacteroidetes bacterium]|nr:hypothetical protein [Bacteroidota bacterium]